MNPLVSIITYIAFGIGFILYHINAYAPSFTSQGIDMSALVAASGAFLGAGVFYSLTIIAVIWRRNLLPAITTHILINLVLYLAVIQGIHILGF